MLRVTTQLTESPPLPCTTALAKRPRFSGSKVRQSLLDTGAITLQIEPSHTLTYNPKDCSFSRRDSKARPTGFDPSSRYRLASACWPMAPRICTSPFSVRAFTRHELCRGPRFRVGAAPSRFFPRAPGRFLAELPFHRWSATSLRQFAALTSIRVCTRRAEFPGGHSQQRAGWVLTTPEASPRSFLSPRPGHCLPAWVSLSPNLPCCGLGRPRGVTPLGARRSCPSSITSRQLRRSGPAWRAGPVKDWLDGIGLAARHEVRRRAPWWTAAPRRLACRGPGPRSLRLGRRKAARHMHG